eukprot:gene14843-biopygen8135
MFLILRRQCSSVASWDKRQRTRPGRGPDVGPTITFEEPDADRTRAVPFLPVVSRIDKVDTGYTDKRHVRPARQDSKKWIFPDAPSAVSPSGIEHNPVCIYPGCNVERYEGIRGMAGRGTAVAAAGGIQHLKPAENATYHM